MKHVLLKPANVAKAIARNLEECPYYPDWRRRVVEQLLSDMHRANDPTEQLCQICLSEPDHDVLNYLLFQFEGQQIAAISYAVSCLVNNEHTTRASQIKAMVVADLCTHEIADEMDTAPMSILMFEALFFDVRRYLGNRSFLREICFPPTAPGASVAARLEARWFQVAYDHGWEGLQRVMFGKIPDDPLPKGSPTTAKKILRERLEDYVRSLDMYGKPPSIEDLRLHSIVDDLKGFCGETLFEKDSPSQPLIETLSVKQLNADLAKLIKVVLKVFQGVVSPSPSHLLQAWELPFFKEPLVDEAAHPNQSNRDLLRATLKGAIPILRSQLDSLSLTQASGKNAATACSSPTAPPGESRIDWRSVALALRNRYGRDSFNREVALMFKRIESLESRIR